MGRLKAGRCHHHAVTHQLSIRSLHARAGKTLQWMRWYAFGVVTPNRKSKSRRLIAAAERVC
jgi:hypothetical protein